MMRLAADQSGTTAVLTALLMTTMLGFVGLGLDAGRWYHDAMRLQQAADSAARSAAFAAADGAKAALNEAQVAAAPYGLVDGKGGVTLGIRLPPSSGAWAHDKAAVEVLIEQPQVAHFAAAFVGDAGPIRVRAVARLVCADTVAGTDHRAQAQDARAANMACDMQAELVE